MGGWINCQNSKEGWAIQPWKYCVFLWTLATAGIMNQMTSLVFHFSNRLSMVLAMQWNSRSLWQQHFACCNVHHKKTNNNKKHLFLISVKRLWSASLVNMPILDYPQINNIQTGFDSWKNLVPFLCLDGLGGLVLNKRKKYCANPRILQWERCPFLAQ